jgi:hypothetical protein
VLLNSQRPGVVPQTSTVVLQKQHLALQVARWNSVSLQNSRDNRNEYQHKKGWIYFKATPNEETLKRNNAVCLMFSEQQAGNQKTTDHKEQINAYPTAFMPDGRQTIHELIRVLGTDLQMSSKNPDNRNSPQDI